MIIDLSVPRNVAPDVSQLEGVYCFDVDDLRDVADQGKERRQAAAADAERIIDEETERSWRILLGESVNAEIGALGRSVDRIRRAELTRADAALADLSPEQRRAVEAMSEALVKKVLRALCAPGRSEAGDLGDVARLLDALGHRIKG